MPIYAYKCDACGHARDVLQKLSDAPLTTCPQCGAQAFSKQVTAAGFQLKGSGWYVTDFRDGNKAAAKKDEKADGADKPAAPATAAPALDTAAPAPVAAGAPAPAAAAPASPAPAPSAGSGS